MSKNKETSAFPGRNNAAFGTEALRACMEQPMLPPLTLLDYMAARAMNAYILSLPPDATLNPSLIANWSYKMAGAMLAARASM